MYCPSSSFSPALNRRSNWFLYTPFLLIHHRMRYLFFLFVITSQQGFMFHLWFPTTLTAFTAISLTTVIIYFVLTPLICLPKCWTIHLGSVNFVSSVLDYFFKSSRTFKLWSFWFFKSAFKSSILALYKSLISLIFILLSRSLMRIF